MGSMRDILDSVAAGDLSPTEAEAALSGYATSGAGRFDAAREDRAGVPEPSSRTGRHREQWRIWHYAIETTDGLS